MDNLNSEGGSDPQSFAAKGAALLLVIGEPFSEEHKKLILGEVSKGFRCWDTEASGVDINDELAQIANKADLGEEGPNGERVIHHNSENLSAEILVNPQTQTVTNAVKNFLSSPSKHKHLIYGGHAFQGSGAWILQDDTYTFNNFAHAFKDQDVGNAVRQQKGSSLFIYTGSEGDWTNGHIAKNDFSKLLDVKLNPADKLETMHGVLQFTAYLSNFVRVRQLNELLQSSDVVGNIRFSRPTLYIFPGCQGDSALFGISGFNLLVNGGYSRKACFWDFTRHLDRIDAALMTHLGADNLFGFGSVLQRKSIENVHPEIGFMYVNASDKIKALPQAESPSQKEDNLHVNLAEEGNKLIQYAKQIGPIPQSCSRTQTGNTIEPINLYHKVGIGSLDMYILNPITDSKEMKDFYQQWNQNVAQFGTSQHMPLPNTLSVCALLVWQPSDPNDNITRIFFPGNAPQHKVLEGLEKLKNIDILKHSKCTKTSLTAKPVSKKPAGFASRPPARSKVSPVTTPRNEVPKKEVKEPAVAKASTPKTKSAPPPPSQRAKKEKEDVNKKAMKAPEKVNKFEKASKIEKTEKADKAGKSDKKIEKNDKSSKSERADKLNKAEKSDKPKKTGSPQKGSAKSSTSSTPKEAVSPVKGATEAVKQEEPAEIKAAPQTSVPDILGSSAPVVPLQEPIVNGSQESSVDPPAYSLEPLQPMPAQPESLIDITPESVPEPSQLPVETESNVPTGALDREKMLELGIYDEDQDIEEDLNAQRPAEESDQRMPHMFGGMTGSMHQDMIDDLGGQQNRMQGSFHGDLMTGSFHESMYDNKTPFDGPFIQNGASVIEEVSTPEDDTTSEEIQPQALPEPVAYAPESYGQEPDVIPTVSAKEEPLEVSEPEIPPASQEPDLLPVKQEAEELYGNDEESTVPVEEKVGYTPMLETPDEVENTLPEDVQEKDRNEETEKEIVAADMLEEKVETTELDVETKEPFVEETKPMEPTEEITSNDSLEAIQDRFPSEYVPEELIPAKTEDVVEDSQVEAEHVEEQPAVEPVPDDEFLFEKKQPALEAERDMLTENVQDLLPAAVDEHFDDRNVDEFSPEPRNADEFSPEPEMQAQENEPELETVTHESPDVPDIIERPESPEPDHLEQEKVINEPDEEPALISQPFASENEFKDKSEDVCNDFTPVEDTPAQLGYNEELEKIGQQNIDAPESDEERAESPDSQLGVQDINRDSLERDMVKEPSPFSSDDQRDSIEKETEEKTNEVSVSGVEQQQRDSIERSPSPMEQPEEITEKSFAPEVETERNAERSVSPSEEPEQRPNEERSVSPSEEPEQRPNEERSVSPGFEPEQRESTEKSFEDDSDESDEDDEEDEESSSFEQEEATDEKCLIQDSASEDKKMANSAEKLLENEGFIVPTDSLASDNLITPESEYTDASHGGQVGYHEIDEQDGDSVEGIEEKDAFASPPVQKAHPFGDGFEQFGGQSGGSGPSGNPFEMAGQPGTNPFIGYEQEDSSSQDEDVGPSGGPAQFNPLTEWGEPMGLPSPAPPGEKNETASAKKGTPKDAGKKTPNDTKRLESKRPGSATKKPAPKPVASNGVPDKSKNRLSLGGSAASGGNLNSSRLSTGGKTTPKPRPGTAPANSDSRSKMNGTKRPATATGSRASPAAVKMPPLPPFHPFYVDLTYIPNHGNPGYSDVEYFKRVRARYYVLSALSPNTQILDALIEGKKTWEDKSLQVTVIPTYDNETLRLWMTLHKDKLADEKVEIAPSASRCTIQLQDHETSSSAYRLEF